MRKEFQLTDEELEVLLEASKPTPVMYLSGGIPMSGSPQENANRAWRQLSKTRGFLYMSVRPIPGKDNHYFTAEELPGVDHASEAEEPLVG